MCCSQHKVNDVYREWSVESTNDPKILYPPFALSLFSPDCNEFQTATFPRVAEDFDGLSSSSIRGGDTLTTMHSEIKISLLASISGILPDSERKIDGRGGEKNIGTEREREIMISRCMLLVG